MTPSEKRIMKMIRSNPYITQQEIADALGTARSSVAVHISNMTAKGIILGRGYLLPDTSQHPNEKFVVVVGGANVDIVGKSHAPMLMDDSNPGEITMSAGGVGFNIASNLSSMKVMTELIVPYGGDARSQYILREKNKFLQMTHSLQFPEETTGTYLVLMDQQGEMLSGINDMSITNKITPKLLHSKINFLNEASVAVFEANLSKKTLEFLVENVKALKVVDAVSSAKAPRLADCLDKIDVLKCNQHEASVLAGVSISSNSDIIKAGRVLREKGVGTVVITAGSDGAFILREEESYHFYSKNLNIVNVTGAGDAFCAIMVHGLIRDLEIIDIFKNAMAASRLIIQSNNSHLTSVTEEELEREKKEVNYEII
ncbi:winged helix-turn-helix transcriptional regulator [Peptoniphilus sp. KCTC 25270]|uniref:carbohydrate kinase n=1 Tax=Peptoniphilus sp. KCTC 25270 TaxID=2897414 RepID=UPI001E4FADDC|nr:carbohydrate kinase [Peptoniphilus sp. KCTC 25270]MCD1146629.1 winged helix-turn-helix transcriptional regulator [Peptoniphilus sp. KCTC 25270]